MSKNIEMNVLTSTGTYESLYPKTLGSLVDGKVSSASTADTATSAQTATTASTADALNSILSIAKGGTGASAVSSAIYNLMNGLGTRTAANLNSYATTTYIPCHYGSTGYKFPLSNIVTYIKNQIGSNSNLQINFTTQTGTGNNLAITYPFNIVYIAIGIVYSMTAKSILNAKFDQGLFIGSPRGNTMQSNMRSIGIAIYSGDPAYALANGGGINCEDSRVYILDNQQNMSCLFTISNVISYWWFLGID